MYRSGTSEEDEWPVELLLHSDPSDIASNALSITCESEMNLTIIPLPSHNSWKKNQKHKKTKQNKTKTTKTPFPKKRF